MQFKVKIYPLPGIQLNADEYLIADHINLSGSSPSGIGFVPVSDLYEDKHDPEALVVVCLKDGTIPAEEEAKLLIKNGAKAYSYELIEQALRAAAEGKKIKAIGVTKA